MTARLLGWFCGLCAMWFADGASSASLTGVGVSLGAPLYYGWLSLLLALCFAPLHGAAAAGLSRALEGMGLWPRASGRALAAAAGVGLAVAAYEVSLHVSTQFNNHELASLLLVVLLAAASALTLGILPPLGRGARWLGERAIVLEQLFTLGAAAAAGWGVWYLIHENRSGFEQLAPGISAGLLALVFGVPLAGWGARHMVSHVAPRTLLACLALCAICSLETAALWDSFAAQTERGTGLASMALKRLRRVSDVDGDGASAWFGGGDCAPFDAAVHPLAVEVIGDGIDNNCLGGDRREPVSLPPPQWTGPPGGEERPENLLILSIDTIRPDHLPMFGYSRNTAPNLAKLAKQSLLFERTYTGAPLTRLAVSSMFASRRASQVQWRGAERRDPMPRVERNQPWLPRILQMDGFRTAAFLPAFSAFERRGNGFDFGFQTYDASAPMEHRGGSMRGFPAEKQVDKAIDWLDQHKSGRFFLWVHLVEPHFEYQRHPSAPKYGKEPQDLYDAEIWHADQQAGRLIEHMRETGRWDDTLVVVVGDHGESFMEHGLKYHGFDLFETGIRTLGMLHGPGVTPGRVEAPVSLLDVAPTVLNLLDVDKDYEELRGQNLLPVLSGFQDPRPQVVVELFRLPLVGYELAIVEDRYKLYYVVDSGRFQFFDLSADPGEQRPLPATHPEYGRLLDHLTAVLESTRSEHQSQAEAKAAAEAQKAKRRAEAAVRAKAQREAVAKKAAAAKKLADTKKNKAKQGSAAKRAPAQPAKRPPAGPSKAAPARPSPTGVRAPSPKPAP